MKAVVTADLYDEYGQRIGIEKSEIEPGSALFDMLMEDYGSKIEDSFGPITITLTR